jgi:hypothetical protein
MYIQILDGGVPTASGTTWLLAPVAKPGCTPSTSEHSILPLRHIQVHSPNLNRKPMSKRKVAFLRPTFTMASRPATPQSAFEALKAVQHLKVSRQNPPTSSEEHGLDYERCSELHNAIARHAWLARGYQLADLPTTTWWQSPENQARLLTIESYLDEYVSCRVPEACSSTRSVSG